MEDTGRRWIVLDVEGHIAAGTEFGWFLQFWSQHTGRILEGGCVLTGHVIRNPEALDLERGVETPVLVEGDRGIDTHETSLDQFFLFLYRYNRHV